jgi:hypothetical protein
MTPGDAARVLAACALYDNRTVGRADAAAWFQTIGDLPVEDALEAVARHYRESTDRMMPAHVRRIVREIREERARATPHEARILPSRFEDDLGRELRASRGAATVREVLAPVVEHLASKRDALPQSAIDELRAITAGPDWVDAEEVGDV